MPQEQRIVHFVGDVQGVGFRYTAVRVGEQFGIGGYVRNLPDGSVECLVEGDAGQIDQFLAALGEQMSYFIRKQTQQTAPFTGRYHSFGIKF